MLVLFQDIKGQEIWINPIHVRMVCKKRKATEITFGVGHGTWGLWVVKVNADADDVAQRLNDAASNMGCAAFPLDDDGETVATNSVNLLG